MDAISTATSGLISAVARLDKAARTVASSGGGSPQAAVDTVEAKTSFAANAAVLKTADRMMGSLLDIIA